MHLMHTEYAYCVGRERKGKMPRLHSRRIHSEQRSFAFTVGERRLGGRRTWRRSGEQQHPARISAAATGDSAGKVRPLLPRLAWLVPVLLALGRRCSSSRWGWRLEESRGVMEGGGGGRWGGGGRAAWSPPCCISFLFKIFVPSSEVIDNA